MTTFGELADILPSDEEDEDDEEYIPEENEDSSSDDGDVVLEDEDDEDGEKPKGKRRSKSLQSSMQPRKRTRGCFGSEDVAEDQVKKSKRDDEQEAESAKNHSVQEDKRVCSDDLWSSFLKKSGSALKRREESSNSTATVQLPQARKQNNTEVKNESPKADSVKEETEKNSLKDLTESLQPPPQKVQPPEEPSPGTSLRPQSVGNPVNQQSKKPVGVSGLLAGLSKKSKMTVLEKSKMDWNSFKTKEGINEELEIHNRGKDGYLERMAFLERADYRQFEIERDMRLGVRRDKRK